MPPTADDGSASPPTRVQKTVAAALGISRRHADAMVTAGRVTVNDRLAPAGCTHLPGDRIAVDGRQLPVPAAASGRIIAYHKPRGQITSRNRPDSVFEALPPPPAGRRWLAIGRLDVGTEGLLLFTDCGEVVNRLAHPSRAIEREYEVHSPDSIADAALADVCRRGLTIDGRRCRPHSFRRLPRPRGTGGRYRVTVSEGRNRLVRKIFSRLQARVGRLIRVRFGSLRLPESLAAGSTLEVGFARIAGKKREKSP